MKILLVISDLRLKDKVCLYKAYDFLTCFAQTVSNKCLTRLVVSTLNDIESTNNVLFNNW